MPGVFKMPSIKFKQSKENARWIELFKKSNLFGLGQCYENASKQKKAAWAEIKQNAQNYGTGWPKILTYNAYGFSAGFCYHNIKNGVNYLKVLTPFNVYDIAVEIYNFEQFAACYDLNENDKSFLNLYLELGGESLEIDFKKYIK